MRKIVYLLFITLLSHVLFAQVTTSRINGAIKSASNEPLIGATIRATHQASGTVYTTTSKGNGQFTIPNMRVGGPYVIEVSFIGYQTERFEDVYLKLDEPFVLNTSLKQGDQTLAGVIVTTPSRNSIFNARRTGTVTNISSRQILTLPSVTRSLNDLLRITPQASPTSTGSIGGGNYRQNYITVDGADFNNTFGIGTNLPAGGSPISLDALEEISINITPFDVKQSGFIGSAINAVTRSGTNNFSGSAYTFFRNENMQGNKVGYNTPFLRQNLQDNTYGFRLGGPIVKNKLFFFVNAEKGKTTSPGQTSFAATTEKPYGSDPSINRPTVTELNEISEYLHKTYGYETGPYQQYDFVSENTRIVGRLDWNISTNHRFNVRYSQVESKSPNFPSTSRSPFSQFANTGSSGRQFNSALWFQNAGYYQEANFYSLSSELNSTFGKFGNTLRATFTHQNDPRSSDSKIFPFVDILKDGLPFTSFGYEPFTYGNLRDVKTTSLVDNLTWTTGKHTWTAGAQVDFSSTKNGFQRFGTSYYTFASWSDFISGKNPTDYAITYSLLPGFEQAYPRFKFAQYSVYGQDEIALTNKLRLTAGLRVDMPDYLDVKEIKTHPLVAALTFANGEKLNTGVLPDTKLLWSPRVGFNWDIKGDRSMQLRGGSGIFTGRVPTVWIVAQSGDAGLLQITETKSGSNVPGPFNHDPAAYRPATPPAAGTSIPSTISAIDPKFKFPQTWKSSLALDAKLPGGITGTIEGIYNKDLNVALGRNANLVNPQPLNVAGYADNRPIYPSRNTDKFINPLISGKAVTPGTLTSAGKDADAFNTPVLHNGSEGYYWSVAAKLEKQFKSGLSASVSYIRSQSKVLYDGSGDQLLNTWSLTYIVNNANSPELSYANYIVPDRVTANLSYRKEYLKNLATTISLFYNGSITGRFSYIYGSDFNRDGQTNDLIYIPKNASEITFTDFNYGTTASPNIYTAKQQSDLFFRYVEQDKYLSSRKGQYAERNGAKMPWRNQIDVKLVQELFTNIGNKRNSIQLTADVINFTNLLNKNWGTFKTVNASSILVPTNASSLVVGGTTKPTFRLATDRNQPVTTTFRDNNSITSTYYMQLGLRYTFN